MVGHPSLLLLRGFHDCCATTDSLHIASNGKHAVGDGVGTGTRTIYIRTIRSDPFLFSWATARSCPRVSLPSSPTPAPSRVLWRNCSPRHIVVSAHTYTLCPPPPHEWLQLHATRLVPRHALVVVCLRPCTGVPEAYLARGKCYPGTDAALGYVLARLRPSRPLTAFDMTYANRVLPWTGPSTPREVSQRAAVLHNASTWEEDFRWALCLSTAAIDEGGRGARPPRHEVAPVMRCRGASAPSLRCGALRCGGSRTVLQNRSACAADKACATYFGNAFSNWTFCIAVGSRRVQRTMLPLGRRAVCAASSARVLARQCHAGVVAFASQ